MAALFYLGPVPTDGSEQTHSGEYVDSHFTMPLALQYEASVYSEHVGPMPANGKTTALKFGIKDYKIHISGHN